MKECMQYAIKNIQLVSLTFYNCMLLFNHLVAHLLICIYFHAHVGKSYCFNQITLIKWCFDTKESSISTQYSLDEKKSPYYFIVWTVLLFIECCFHNKAPQQTHILKVNNWNTFVSCHWSHSGVALVSLLLTLNIFHYFF